MGGDDMKKLLFLMMLFVCVSQSYSADAYIVTVDRWPEAFQICTLQTIVEVSGVIDAARMDFEDGGKGIVIKVRPVTKRIVYDVELVNSDTIKDFFITPKTVKRFGRTKNLR
jgi:hypothetical protein